MKKLLFLAAFLMALTQTHAQQGIKFPYTYGIHTYILGNQDYVAFYKDCKANGFDYIEVNPGEYGGGSTEEAIYNGSMRTLEAMDEAGVYAWSVHLPYGGSSSDISVIDEESRKKVVANLSNYIRALLPGLPSPALGSPPQCRTGCHGRTPRTTHPERHQVCKRTHRRSQTVR